MNTTNSSDFYVHIIWLIEGLEVWHRSGGKRGHSPDNTKRYVVSSILNHEAGNDLVSADRVDSTDVANPTNITPSKSGEKG